MSVILSFSLSTTTIPFVSFEVLTSYIFLTTSCICIYLTKRVLKRTQYTLCLCIVRVFGMQGEQTLQTEPNRFLFGCSLVSQYGRKVVVNTRTF